MQSGDEKIRVILWRLCFSCLSPGGHGHCSYLKMHFVELVTVILLRGYSVTSSALGVVSYRRHAGNAIAIDTLTTVGTTANLR